MDSLIRKTEVTHDAVTLELRNGVRVLIGCHPEYLHLSFSCIDGDIAATPHAREPSCPRLWSGNSMDVEFRPKPQ